MGSGHTGDELVGTWKLVSASTTTSTGERSEIPYGPSPDRSSHLHGGWQSDRHDQPRGAKITLHSCEAGGTG